MDADIETVNALAPYWWDIAVFFWLLFVFRSMQSIKRFQHFPAFLCKVKTSKNGKHKFKKLKVIYIDGLAASLSAIGIYFIERQLVGVRYDGIEQLIIVTVIVALSAQTLIKIAITYISKTHPEIGEILVDGLYKPEDDLTVFDKTMMVALVGGGVDKRPSKPLSDSEITEITKPRG